MKRLFGIITIVICSCTWAAAQNESQDQYNDQGNDSYYQNNNNYDEQQGDNNGVSFQEFYDQLGPYGTWTRYPGYGYVWIPVNMPPDFSPYITGGHWEYTDYGMTWVSDYEWGWAPFHYGRWFQDPAYGWMWMPGYDWAPAWVVWGDYEGYYCWAPVGPYEYMNGHHFNRGNHNWYFVPHEHITREHIDHYRVTNTVVMHNINSADIERKINVINHANSYKTSVFYTGPKKEEIEKTAHIQVRQMTVNNVAKPAAAKLENDRINIYRPDMNRTSVQHAAPAKVAEPANIRHDNQPASNTSPQRSPRASEPQHTAPQSEPIRETRPEPMHQAPAPQWTPPRQNAPQPAPQRPSGGFVPREAPVQRPQPSYQAPQRSMPAPAPVMPHGGGRH